MRNDISALFNAYEWFIQSEGPLSFEQLFGNNHPVEVEIGCGKGRFLSAYAGEACEINFLGIDRVGKWMKRAQARIEKGKVENLKFLRADARVFLEKVPHGSVSVFHIYFPDPWPKKRHHKRRLVTKEFLAVLHDRLVSEGKIRIATDNKPYYESMREAVAWTPSCWSQIREDENKRPFCEAFKTSYELKYEGEGKPLYYLELQK
ncbi:MAG: tRNA (guanosine(46)-N7)-methyltransferase TrmB [Candidatus Omnitrophica bacterium]|nr:tRNA (guanosine(46)-N7)-methyltransferase TrmB [Candidatus Omnitrophota bacterium]